MNCDIISQVCVFCDYPIWRYQLKKYRYKINRVILYPSRHHGVIDMEGFLKQVIPETWVTPVPIDYGREDWRQAETDPCLAYSDSEWIWFTEQDFFARNWDKFYSDVEGAMKYSDMIGWYNKTDFPYIHPSCLFIKREMLEKTKKDFSAHPEIPGCDHFAMIIRDVEKAGGKITTLQSLGYRDLGFHDWQDCFHLGGLTYAYQNWKGDGTDVFGTGHEETFYIYNHWSRWPKVTQSPEYLDLSMKIEEYLYPKHKKTDVMNNRWTEFFYYD